MRLDELAKMIGAELHGDGAVEISAVGTLTHAAAGHVTFLANPKYAPQLAGTRASAVIAAASTPIPRQDIAVLRSKDPYYALRQAVVALHGHRRHGHQGVHPKAHVEESAKVGQGTVIYPQAYIGPNVRIGLDCVIYPNVTIYEGCVLGDRVIVHAGAVIGADGFGFASSKGIHHKIPQVGIVVIEDDVEVGANSCIDRAALGQTVIGKGTKIDDLVMVGHNTHIGAHSLLVAQSGIAGSTTTGHHLVLAGQAGVAGHLELGDCVVVGGQAGVVTDQPSQTTVSGLPARPIGEARRITVLTGQLPEIVKRLKAVEQAVEELGHEQGEEQ